MPEQAKCTHLPCACQSLPGDDFCSDTCRDACHDAAREADPEKPAGKCACGHDGCCAELISLETAASLNLATEALAGA
jgi:hypothetical protein